MTASLTIAMDEAGNTGERLLDPQQPVYALASIRSDNAVIRTAVQAALGRTQMTELKFSALRRSGPGRRNTLQLLDDLKLDSDRAAVSVVHKPHMLGLKMIDELVEPRMLQRGLQAAWYASGSATNMAHAFADQAPRALGEVYSELASSFEALVRNHSPDTTDAFQRALRRSRIASTSPDVSDILDLMISHDDELQGEFATRTDALDPAIPSLFFHAGHWTQALGAPFEILHDDSNTIARWAHIFELMRKHVLEEREHGHAQEPRSLVMGEVEVVMPDELIGIEFGQSDREPRIQVADILAGAGAHLYAVKTSLRPSDAFARDLERAGVGDLLQHEIGPRSNPPTLHVRRG